MMKSMLRKRGIAYLNFSEDELAEEWQAAAELPTPGTIAPAWIQPQPSSNSKHP